MFRILRDKWSGRKLDTPSTVNYFKEQAVFYPDQPLVDWRKVVLGQMITPNSIGRPLDVCVVGRGASALGVMTEFNEIAKKNPNLAINVKNKYYDEEVEEARDPLVTYDSKYGRIFSVNPGAESGKSNNFQEIGCMRFPSIAILTWNYISHAYPGQGDEELKKFPNPGRVPTQFLYRDMNVIFLLNARGEAEAIAGMNNEVQLANLGVMEAVKNGVINYMLDNVKASNSSDEKSVRQFADSLIGNENQTPELWQEWERFLAEYDIPMINIAQDAIEQLITTGCITLTPSRDRDYFIELFGRYGFGTGGFRPLNNVTFNEIARLLIWNYSDEYLFPGNLGNSASANTDFAVGLANRLDANNLTLDASIEKVLFIGFSESEQKLFVLSYCRSSGTLEPSFHDYVVLATTHHAAQRILEPFAGLLVNAVIPQGSVLNFEINNKLYTYETGFDLSHPFDMKNGGSGKLYGALKNLHMMRTTKYFTDVNTNIFESFAPGDSQKETKVKMVISDTDLAATYCLDGQNGTTNILVSYTWGDEASNEASVLRGLTSYAGSSTDITLRKKHAQSTNRFATQCDYTVKTFWVSEMLAKAPVISGYMYDWTADQDSRGAFKLDWASETAFSAALYNHNRISVRDYEGGRQPQQRLFVAGDSFSHYGGWLEGAFMTGITATAGVMRSEFGARVFTEEGLKLFSDLSDEP